MCASILTFNTPDILRGCTQGPCSVSHSSLALVVHTHIALLSLPTSIYAHLGSVVGRLRVYALCV